MPSAEENRRSIRSSLEPYVEDEDTEAMADYLAKFFAGEGITSIEFADPEPEDRPKTS